MKLEHKAKIEIDETGTKASTSTLILEPHYVPVYVKCDHPFMFIIYDETHKEIMFAGVYRGPNVY